jgi:hypothetical protein
MKRALAILCLMATAAQAGTTFGPLRCEGLKDGDASVFLNNDGAVGTMTTVIKSKHIHLKLNAVWGMSHHYDYGLDSESARECTPETSPKPCTEWLFPYGDVKKGNRFVINLESYSGICDEL